MKNAVYSLMKPEKRTQLSSASKSIASEAVLLLPIFFYHHHHLSSQQSMPWNDQITLWIIMCQCEALLDCHWLCSVLSWLRMTHSSSSDEVIYSLCANLLISTFQHWPFLVNLFIVRSRSDQTQGSKEDDGRMRRSSIYLVKWLA